MRLLKLASLEFDYGCGCGGQLKGSSVIMRFMCMHETFTTFHALEWAWRNPAVLSRRQYYHHLLFQLCFLIP